MLPIIGAIIMGVVLIGLALSILILVIKEYKEIVKS